MERLLSLRTLDMGCMEATRNEMAMANAQAPADRALQERLNYEHQVG